MAPLVVAAVWASGPPATMMDATSSAVKKAKPAPSALAPAAFSSLRLLTNDATPANWRAATPAPSFEPKVAPAALAAKGAATASPGEAQRPRAAPRRSPCAAALASQATSSCCAVCLEAALIPRMSSSSLGAARLIAVTPRAPPGGAWRKEAPLKPHTQAMHPRVTATTRAEPPKRDRHTCILAITTGSCAAKLLCVCVYKYWERGL
mmetsp:Transcript_56106/g.133639  ORF Transcript_56106/g.133639 Transcript_56106/m.133639 type:complete len:207 (+) Transcript_56106:1114-1734(+)